VPEPPTVIQGWFVDATHAHPLAATTSMLPAPPADVNVVLAGVRT
jgi:hypothetical protein